MSTSVEKGQVCVYLLNTKPVAVCVCAFVCVWIMNMDLGMCTFVCVHVYRPDLSDHVLII